MVSYVHWLVFRMAIAEMTNRQRALLIGGIGGALVGLLGSRLFLRSTQEEDRSDCPVPVARELINLALSIVSILRHVAAMG
jgi:hypothetical protein